MYLTTALLQSYIYGTLATPLPDNAPALIRAAEGLVDDALRGTIYPVNSSGLPTDADDLAAIISATAEQAQAWILGNIDPRLGVAQLPAVVVSKSALGVSLTVQNSSRHDLETLAGGTQLTSAALAYLRRAGLITAHISATVPAVRRLAVVYSPTESGLV